MKKQAILLVAMTLAVTGLTGCKQKPAQDSPTASPEQSMEENIKTMSKAVESGKPVKCTVIANDESMPEAINLTYWIKGQNMRMETIAQGQQQAVVIKDEVAHIKVDSTLFGSSTCDWLTIQQGIEDETEETPFQFDNATPDYDYKEFENNENYSINCEEENFGDEKFEVEGSICSMEDLMGGMFQL